MPADTRSKSYPKDQHTVVPNDDIGYLILDGQAFCPTLPPRLRNLHLVEDLTAKNPEGRTHITAEEQQAWDERAAARKEFMQLIAERNTYRLESKGPARNRKGIRYVCPVTTGRLDVSTHPAPHLRKECCRKSITIPFSVHGKLRQKHVWGTREWFRSYARRTAVERFFGNIKGLTGIMRAG